MPFNYVQAAADFDARVKSVASKAPKIVATTWRTHRILNDVLHTSNKWLNDGRYSPQGKRDKIRADIQKSIREFTLVKAAVERHAAAMPNMRAETEAKAFAKYANDPMGPEIRATVRAMNHGDRVAAALADPRVLGAIATAPAMLHGVEANALAHVVTAHLQKEHPDALAKIAAQEEALAAATGSLEILERAVKEAVAFEHPRALADFLADHGASPQDLEIEAKGGVPSGLPKFSMDESFDKIMTDGMTGLAA
jgi:hypothetical protein